jgi:glycosyltransferase involved in cell wall biosynthesis
LPFLAAPTFTHPHAQASTTPTPKHPPPLRTMKILIHAATLRVGGGKSVGTNFIQCLQKYPQHEFIAITPTDPQYQALEAPNVRIVQVPPALQQFYKKWMLEKWILQQAARFQPHVIYAMGNIALPTKQYKQVVLFHLPHAIYADSPAWKRMSWKEWLYAKLMVQTVKNRFPYAQFVIAQTETAARRFKSYFHTDKVAVVPNAVTLPTAQNNNNPPTIQLSDKYQNFFCLTYYYPHKNIEVLIEAAKLVKQQGLNYRFVTTIAPEHGEGAVQFLKKVADNGLDDVIQNIGPIHYQQIPNLYIQSAGLLLPTLLESFSGTYVEAMYFKRPIFTSDMDFAHDVCGDVGYYFDPLDAAALVRCITQAYADPTTLQANLTKGYQRVTAMPDWNTAAANMMTILEQVANNPA